jgi:hypothetical protein
LFVKLYQSTNVETTSGELTQQSQEGIDKWRATSGETVTTKKNKELQVESYLNRNKKEATSGELPQQIHEGVYKWRATSTDT